MADKELNEEIKRKIYNYDDIKLTCPFCKSEMFYSDMLVCNSNMPEKIQYTCSNLKCWFDLVIDFDEFDKRIEK